MASIQAEKSPHVRSPRQYKQVATKIAYRRKAASRSSPLRLDSAPPDTGCEFGSSAGYRQRSLDAVSRVRHEILEQAVRGSALKVANLECGAPTDLKASPCFVRQPDRCHHLKPPMLRVGTHAEIILLLPYRRLHQIIEICHDS